MKRFLLICTFILSAIGSLFAGEMVLRGTYQGDNLYVKNPFASSGVGFCVYEVTVNGATSTDEINSSAFEIDLSVYGFKIGDEVLVAIRYKDDCLPKVLNPDVLSPKATFNVQSIKIEGERLVWSTLNESGRLPFIVEQFRWNKWVKVGELEGKGAPGSNSYSVPLRFHSGENRFRVRQTDSKSKSKLSPEVTLTAAIPEVTFTPERVDDLISFSSPTMYEIYDEYGGIVFKGYGSSVKVAGLQKGRYYINYDNKMERFTKK
ncbi:MAG: hypothetical protein QM786_18240 [Breznakibacter sp.]